MKNKRYFWYILLLLLAVCVVIALFWDAILIRVAPKYVLKSALTTVISQLEERFAADPLLILVNTVDPEGKYTADLSVYAENNLLGEVHYDLRVQTDGRKHRFHVQGTASTPDTELDIAAYLDQNYMAFSSEQLASGVYYGLTFDTFQSDIRSIPLLDFFITNKMISQWDSGLQDIRQRFMQTPVSVQIPRISEAEKEALLLGLLALPSDVTEVAISNGDGYQKCRALSYHINAEQVKLFLGDAVLADSTAITATFYLSEKSLIKVQLNITEENRGTIWKFDLGQAPLSDTLSVQCAQSTDGSFCSTEITVDTQQTDDRFYEVWNISRSEDGEQGTRVAYSYEYQPSTGMIALSSSDSDQTTYFTLTQTELGFRMESEDFSSLLRLLNAEAEMTGSLSGSITVAQGSEIISPEYKNLNEWSLDDFWTLLTGIGSLLGISISP